MRAAGAVPRHPEKGREALAEMANRPARVHGAAVDRSGVYDPPAENSGIASGSPANRIPGHGVFAAGNAVLSVYCNSEEQPSPRLLIFSKPDRIDESGPGPGSLSAEV